MSFLSKWNPFSRISEEVSEFPEARKILYNVLHNWSKNLADPDVDLDSVAEIAQMLMDLGSDFEEIKQAGFQDGAKPGKCFAMKCDIIASTLRHVSDHLQEDPHQRFLMADVVDMICKHVGRLTLSAFDNTDVFALRMDSMVSLVEKRFHERVPEADPDLENRNNELYEIWTHLCHVVPSCYCLQCGKRSVLNEF